MSDVVRCVDCGLVSLRQRQSRELCEIEGIIREKWYVAGLPTIPGGTYEGAPICSVRAADLPSEMVAENPEESLRTINRPRNCQMFVVWHPGFSPKVHREMLSSKQQHEFQAEERGRERAWQSELREQERAFQIKFKEDERRWQEEQNRINRARQFWYVILAGVIGLIGVLIGKLVK
jgi:hypothetical protein